MEGYVSASKTSLVMISMVVCKLMMQFFGRDSSVLAQILQAAKDQVDSYTEEEFQAEWEKLFGEEN